MGCVLPDGLCQPDRHWWNKALQGEDSIALTVVTNLSLLSQPQKKKMKKDLTGKKRKQTSSSDEPDSKAAKTDGSDNSDSDNGECRGPQGGRQPPRFARCGSGTSAAF